MDIYEKSRQDCLQYARKLFQGELDVEVIDAEQEWDPTSLRSVLDQTMLIKRELFEFEIITDEDDMIAGFIDHSLWSADKMPALPVEQLLDIAVNSGWVTNASRAVSDSRFGQSGEMIFDIEQNIKEQHVKFQVGVNTLHNKLIYLLPEGVTPNA